MRTVVLTEVPVSPISINDVPENTPIFVKKDGMLVGMVVCENAGWIIRVGGRLGANGHKETRYELLKSCEEFGYTYHVK